MYIDIHAHILPKVDDGARDMSESLELLRMLKTQKVDAVVLTPHFYAFKENSVTEYKERILSAFRALSAARDNSMPELYLGSEVRLFRGISTSAETPLLCIGDTKYILLEFPYTDVSQALVDEVIALSLNRGLIPILAHIERYSRFEGFELILSLIRDGYALGQVNADSLSGFFTRRRTLGLLKKKCVSFVASDTHRTDHRPPLINMALNAVEKRLGTQVRKALHKNSEKIYNEIKRDIS